MPSPFPGMDPYLEAPRIWPDFHHALATTVQGALNRALPRPYYARIEMRPEIGIVGDDDGPRSIVSHIAVVKPIRPAGAATLARSASEGSGGVAVLDRPQSAISPSLRMRVPNEPLRHHFVEIRDASSGHALVTLIEIVSPSNKRPGPDRRAYEAKQREILQSNTSLVELDLLRGGEGIVGGPAIVEAASRLQPRPDYLVGVSRAWLRGAELDYELFSVRLDEPLPCIPIPLRKGGAEVPLDVQYTFQQAYDGGPYSRGAVDYRTAPDPLVRSELADWVTGCVTRWSAGN
jgi:hypothetical protein